MGGPSEHSNSQMTGGSPHTQSDQSERAVRSDVATTGHSLDDPAPDVLVQVILQTRLYSDAVEKLDDVQDAVAQAVRQAEEVSARL